MRCHFCAQACSNRFWAMLLRKHHQVFDRCCWKRWNRDVIRFYWSGKFELSGRFNTAKSPAVRLNTQLDRKATPGAKPTPDPAITHDPARR
jgi:hypothetical protein